MYNVQDKKKDVYFATSPKDVPIQYKIIVLYSIPCDYQEQYKTIHREHLFKIIFIMKEMKTFLQLLVYVKPRKSKWKYKFIRIKSKKVKIIKWTNIERKT